jgi:hypothetical protein
VILAMRRQAPVILAVALVGVSLVAAAEVVLSNVPAPAPAVTFDQVRVFVYTTLAMVLLAVCGSAAGLVAFVLNRDRAAAAAAADAAKEALAADHSVREEQFAVIGDAVKVVGAAVKQLGEALERHDEAPFAHSAAIHASHDPLTRQVSEIAESLSALRAEHNVIHRNEDAICSLLQKRDPAMSPHPRRETDDPSDDWRRPRPEGPFRGKQ